MEALVPAFVLAVLCEQGDRTQLLTVALVERYRAPGATIAGIAVAAAILLGIAGAGGAVAAATAPHSGLVLLTGLALLLAGGGALFRAKPAPSLDGWRLGSLLSSAGSFLILAFGDKTQFTIFALAAASGQPVLAAVGGTAGVVVGNLPAAILGADWPRVAPLGAIRRIVGALIAIAGVVVAVAALRIM